ncbi:UDP-N-acetylmuramoyl-L-alanine--D-glutamate ligase [Patescibacteria group bacterium AH-259-L05]|nr:UDP-N-acetylmuramoyl-L-alanine--D-glutamate ligase [Patescibacteria group bacterium AH-259-L05]
MDTACPGEDMLDEKITNARRITVMGLGSYKQGSGISTALFFAKLGAKVLVTDLKTGKELQSQVEKLKIYKNVSFVLGRHRKQDFKNIDLVFQNPLVPDYSPYIQLARKNNIPVINDWTIFLSLCDNVVVGITGTKGKSTTTSLIYEFLKAGNVPAVLCGNIGDSPLQYFLSPRHSSLSPRHSAQSSCHSALRAERQGKGRHSSLGRNTVMVAELSSWLLRGFKEIKTSPHIAVITNLLVDHQDKYKGLKVYYRDKENIFKYQNSNDYLILNKDNAESRKLANKAQSNIYWFSKNTFDGNGVYIQGSSIYFQASERKVNGNFTFPSERRKQGFSYFQNNQKRKKICLVSDIKIKGEHNKENVLAAILAALLYGVDQKNIIRVLRAFKGIPYRLEYVRTIQGVQYYNDTAATSPDATIAALQTFQDKKGKIVLIGGGHDKNLDYKDYVKEVNKYVKALILFPGTATDKILNYGSPVSIVVSSMREVIEQAQKVAQKGDIVLLSPGAASYGLFKNEFDRGNQFMKLVKKL